MTGHGKYPHSAIQKVGHLGFFILRFLTRIQKSQKLKSHTVETRAILELVFHVFEENELICAEVLLLSLTLVDSSETTSSTFFDVSQPLD